MCYTNTFITVAADCPIEQSQIPVSNREKKPAHVVQYECLTKSPYTYGHEELIFESYLAKEEIGPISEAEKQEIWNKLFSKGHPCLRASALTKRYGFGAHYNENQKIALYPMESKEYQEFLKDGSIKKVPAMKSKR